MKRKGTAMSTSTSNVNSGDNRLYNLIAFSKEVDHLLSTDAAFKKKFERATAKSAHAALHDAGENVSEESILKSIQDDTTTRGGVQLYGQWWGFQLYIPSPDLQSFTADAAAIVRQISNVVSASWVQMVATFIAAGLGMLKSLDHGRGVWISMSWFAPGIFVPTSA
jgi:hypothetical protein